MTFMHRPLIRLLPCVFAVTLQLPAQASDEDDQKTSGHNYRLAYVTDIYRNH